MSFLQGSKVLQSCAGKESAEEIQIAFRNIYLSCYWKQDQNFLLSCCSFLPTLTIVTAFVISSLIWFSYFLREYKDVRSKQLFFLSSLHLGICDLVSVNQCWTNFKYWI